MSQPLGCGSLPRASHGNVAEADDIAAQLAAAENARFVPGQFQVDETAVDEGKNVENAH